MNDKLIRVLRSSLGWIYDLRSRTRDLYTQMKITEHMEEMKNIMNDLESSLATGSRGEHSDAVSERHDNDHLIHALHDVSKELVRATGEIRSLLFVLSKLDLINLEKTNMKISELSGSLNDVKTSTLKAFSEIRNRIDVADARIIVLEKSLSDADIPAEAQAALDDLKVVAKQLDDIVPDAPELPPVVNPPAPA